MAVSTTLGALLLLLFVTRYYGDRIYQWSAIIAFLGHTFVSVVLIPRVPYSWDIGQFHRVAVSTISGEFPSASQTVTSFGTFQSLLYALFPAQSETVGIFNGLFAVLTFLPISYIAHQLYPKLPETSYGLMALILYLPLPFFFLSIPMREALSVLLFFTFLALGIHCLSDRNGILALTGFPLWGIMYLFRPELALVSLLGLTAAIVTETFRVFDVNLSLTSLAVVLGGIGAVGFGLFAELLYSFQRVNSQLAYRAQGGAVYLDGMQYTSWFDFLLAAPARAIYFQFAPFPLHVESAFHLLAFTATPIVIILFISAARSLYESDYNETVAVLLVVVYLAGITGYGVINSNFGTNVRHRITFDFLLIILAAPVIQRWELLAREWLGVVPRQRGGRHEQQREAEEFDGHVHTGGQHTNETE